jgi:large subunit ribosomal protein L21
MKYAVIAISGSQFKVEENQKLDVNNLNLKEGEKSSTDQVLLIADDKETNVGMPTVKNAKVEFTVLKNYKGKKTTIFKYKSKSRYRKTMGFRPQLTQIQITKILTK